MIAITFNNPRFYKNSIFEPKPMRFIKEFLMESCNSTNNCRRKTDLKKLTEKVLAFNSTRRSSCLKSFKALGLLVKLSYLS